MWSWLRFLCNFRWLYGGSLERSNVSLKATLLYPGNQRLDLLVLVVYIRREAPSLYKLWQSFFCKVCYKWSKFVSICKSILNNRCPWNAPLFHTSVAARVKIEWIALQSKCLLPLKSWNFSTCRAIFSMTMILLISYLWQYLRELFAWLIRISHALGHSWSHLVWMKILGKSWIWHLELSLEW